MDAVVLTVEGVDALIAALHDQGFVVIGPTVRDGAIVHAEISGVAELPRGVGDAQESGSYRLRRRDDDALFGYTAPAQSWKSVLFPARELLRDGSEPPGTPSPGTPSPSSRSGPYALFGVRSCDLHAIAIHDRVLTGRQAVDVRYARRRADAFIVAVACTTPGATCFCASTGTGPAPDPDAGYDICLTELLDGGHRLLAVPATDRGRRLLAHLPSTPAPAAEVELADATVAAAARQMGRSLDLEGLRDLLYGNAEHPQWEDVGARCLACTNCTLVCPTCFCTSVEEVSALAAPPKRWRVWDSCFTTDFSYLHGGSVRESTSSRYRQWATHKLAAWQDQFGMVGCVGCGRCITWCPAAIDLTAEVAAIRANPRPPSSASPAASTSGTPGPGDPGRS